MDFFERQELGDQEENEKKEKELNETRGADEKRKQANQTRESGKMSLPKASSALTAFTEIEIGHDWAHFLIITLSIIADVISSVPYLGALTGIFFLIIFYVLYFLTGQFKNRALAKVAISGLAFFLESVGGIFLISLAPLFTASAISIYWLELSYCKENKTQ